MSCISIFFSSFNKKPLPNPFHMYDTFLKVVKIEHAVVIIAYTSRYSLLDYLYITMM